MPANQSQRRDIGRVFELMRSAVDRRILILGLTTVVVVVVSGACAALTPLVLKSLIDAVAFFSRHERGAQLSSVGTSGAEYLLLLIVGRGLGDLRPILSGTLNQRLHSRLSRRFFAHVSRLPMGYLVKRRSGELIQTLDLASAGAQMVLAHFATNLLPVLVELVTMIVVLVGLGQPALVEIFCTSAVAYLAVFSLGARRMMRAADDVSAANLETYARLGDSVAHLETLRYFAAERQASRRLASANALLERCWLRLNQLNAMIAAGASLIFALSLAGCLYVGATAVRAQAMSLGGFVLTTVYMLQMVQPLESLGSATRDLARAMGCLQPLLDLLSEPLSHGAIGLEVAAGVLISEPPCALAVRIENLHFAYEPGRPVLKGVDFEVPAGSITAIVGRSGSGKSSLARLLLRVYAPQQGRILLGGHPVESIDVEDLRTRLVSLVPQETALLHDTIAHNIALGMPMASREDIHRAARAAQLGRLLDSLPQGLDTPVGERGMQLSGGERQRVGIARAMLRRPALYVLDEPTSMLDSKTEFDILKTLRATSAGASTIVIAHRLSTIVDADEIVVLDEGRVRERGSHQCLIASNGLYAQMWRQQVSGVP